MKKDSTLYILVFITCLTIAFGAGVSVVHHLTRDMLAENELLHYNRTLARAFGLEVPGSAASHYQEAVSGSLDYHELDYEGRSWRIYLMREVQDSPLGFVFRGRGVWDVINGVLVLDHGLETILSLEFLEQHETPGLGARIEEDWFRDQFRGLEISWDRPANRRIVIGADTGPDSAGRVDAITGATQTSRALMDSINRELETFRELVREEMPTIKN